MKTLVINTGSSSIKYQLLQMPEGELLCSGLIERIGENKAALHHTVYDGNVENRLDEEKEIKDHVAGLRAMVKLLSDDQWGSIDTPSEIELVGHRVVHGGEKFTATQLITEEVKKEIDELSSLAPLHNPANLLGITSAEEVFPGAKHIAVFDTAFHQSIPEKSFRYAIPEKYYKKNGIRAYGFHGSSHRYVSNRAAAFLQLKESKIICLHLGNGASASAVLNGTCIETSLGMTPISGLVMGSRVGDIDPGVLIYMLEEMGMDWKQMKHVLNKESGLEGLYGNNDLRILGAAYDAGEEKAKLAIDIYCHRIKKYIGAYFAALGGCDALVFTAGVGENSALVRKLATQGLEALGIEIDPTLNAERSQEERDISAKNAKVKTLVIPTNEELEIARQSYRLINESA